MNKHNLKKQIRELRDKVKLIQQYRDHQYERANKLQNNADILKLIAVFAFIIGMMLVIAINGNYLNSYYNPALDEVCRQSFGSGYIIHNQRFGSDDAIYCQYNQSLIPKPYIPAIKSVGGQNDGRQ